MVFDTKLNSSFPQGYFRLVDTVHTRSNVLRKGGYTIKTYILVENSIEAFL